MTMPRLLPALLMAVAVLSVSAIHLPSAFALIEPIEVLVPAVQPTELAVDPEDPEDRAEAERVWAAYEQRWAETDSYAAQFTQVIELGGIDAKVESAGRFYFAKPDLMRWEYTEGPPQEVVGDGAVMWVYQSDLEQVYKVDYATAFGEGGLVSLLAGRRGISERYDARLGQGDAESVVISLTGRAGEGTIDVRVDHQTFDLREVVVVDPAGSVTRMKFDDVLRNSDVDPALFSFTPPKGVDIIESPAARP
jgi:outer membrane lipoprotein carrier protein